MNLKNKEKKEISVFARKKRQEISEKKHFSERIHDLLASQKEFTEAKTIMVYLSTHEEVQTLEFIKSLKKNIIVPVVKGNKIVPSLLAEHDFEEGEFGILEPKRKIKIPSKYIDLVIVPGIAFDAKGNRIGYGKGYYDKFLKKITAPKIAFAFECQLVDKINACKWDIPMDKIITEERVIQCRF